MEVNSEEAALDIRATLAEAWRKVKRATGGHFRRTRGRWIVSTLLLLLVVTVLWPSVTVTIQAGEAGVLYRRLFGGTALDRVYGEGLHFILPWDTMTIYTVRFQTKPHQLEVLTQTGMHVKVSLSIRYKPEYDTLAVLHQKVGPDYFNTVIVPDVEATIRKVAGKYEVEELFATKTDVLQKMTNEAYASAADKFIKIDAVQITQVDLPPAIKTAIEKKQEEQQLAEAYVYKLDREKKEAERKEIEAKGIRDANTIITSSLSDHILRWKGIDATLSVAQSQNSKIVLFGSGKSGLPLLFDTNTTTPPAPAKGR